MSGLCPTFHLLGFLTAKRARTTATPRQHQEVWTLSSESGRWVHRTDTPYVGGDPANKNDPTGLYFFCDASEDCPIDAVRENDSGAGGAFVGDPQAEAEASYAASLQQTITTANIQAALNAALSQPDPFGALTTQPPFDITDSQAFNDAYNRLDLPDCESLLTPQAGAYSESIAINGQNYPQSVLSQTTYVVDPGSNAVGQQNQASQPTVVHLGSDSGFLQTFNPGDIVNMTIANPTVGRAPVRASMPSATYQSLVLLHETGHGTQAFSPDGSNEPLNSAYTIAVLQNCFPEVEVNVP